MQCGSTVSSCFIEARAPTQQKIKSSRKVEDRRVKQGEQSFVCLCIYIGAIIKKKLDLESKAFVVLWSCKLN